MESDTPYPADTPVEVDWRKNPRLIRKGLADLEYLPRGLCAWHATLAALAWSARRQIAGPAAADLGLWAAMHGCTPSARWRELGDRALVLWHGTSARRAEKIRQFGLACKGGVWAATEPLIAHGYARYRGSAFDAGSAMIVVVLDKDEWDSRGLSETPKIARFHHSIPPDCIEYILWGDRIEFVGLRKARQPRPWGVGRFKKHEGLWVPHSRPPVRLDAGRYYGSLDEWLDHSIGRVLETLGQAAAIEVFSSLYATIDPWDALPHEQVFDALARRAGPGRPARGRMRRFSLTDSP